MSDSPTDPRVEAVARAVRDTLSWENERPALKKWHIAMAEAALAAADAVSPRADALNELIEACEQWAGDPPYMPRRVQTAIENARAGVSPKYEWGRVHLTTGKFHACVVGASDPECWSDPVYRRVEN